MKHYTFNQLSKTAKNYAVAMFNKYNNPKKKDAIVALSAPIWKFTKTGELYNGLTN